MKVFKLSLIFFISALFLISCDTAQIDETSYTKPYPDVVEQGVDLAKDNLDLEVVGNLLERANNAEEFERLLNTEGGVNNLDLNRDGYGDYISVAEYDDRYPDQRGFVLYDNFGFDDIQEIVRIVFDREPRYTRGARVLLIGNEQIYGDNYYYETNWLDKSLAIADWVFTDRDVYYYSPYYYDYYPDYYEVYSVVATPVYQTRIREYYYQPIFVRTVDPTITEIKIKSKYKGRTTEKILANLVKPTREQINYKRNHPKSEFVNYKDDRIKEKSSGSERGFENKSDKNPNRTEKQQPRKNEKFEVKNQSERGQRNNVKPNKPEKVERPAVKPTRPDKNVRENVKTKVPNKPNNQVKQKSSGQNPNKGNGGNKGNKGSRGKGSTKKGGN